MQGRTVIMATHRPALLELADRVLYVSSGVLSEIGITPPRVRPLIRD
jgi:ABC-type protease/lipase transport system fused ATPase/permease subunit